MLICKKPRIFDIDLYGLAAISGLVVFVWLFVINPMDRESVQISREQEVKQQENQEAQSELVRLQSVVRNQQALTNRVRHYVDVLTQNHDIPEVIRLLGRFSGECSVRLNEITPSETFISEHFQKTGLSLRLYGTFPQLRIFLAEIFTRLPSVKVRSMSLVRKDMDQGTCDIMMELDVFEP
ncbi:MAG: type 4a pilus biogenesis protein PilO, partial [Sedimentisphaerales bacterium]|nr:type 4a pilus biogenesis protein PilO [Sedimentisphaerales bacterium]